MANQSALTMAKIDILEKANSIVLEEDNSIGLFVVGSVDNVVLAINVVKGSWDWTPPGDGVECDHFITRKHRDKVYAIPRRRSAVPSDQPGLIDKVNRIELTGQSTR